MEEATCSHGRSYIYFTESILKASDKNCSYIGHSWDSNFSNLDESFLETTCPFDAVCPKMGIQSIDYYPNATGTYFIPVNENVPYCSAYFFFLFLMIKPITYQTFFRQM